MARGKLTRGIAEIQSGRRHGLLALAWSLTLIPVSMIYWLGTILRAWLYRLHLLPSKHPIGKVISIGNITTGGTGKTPFTVMLARRLLAHGRKVAILSRGYGATGELSEVIIRGNQVDPSFADQLGDEVVAGALEVPECWFGVGKNRYANAQVLSAKHKTDCFLLDDGFQHLKIRRDLDIVLIDATAPFGNGLLFPSGNLRESTAALARADIVVISKANEVEIGVVRRLCQILPRYVASERICQIVTAVNAFRDISSSATIDPATLGSSRVILFSGIGNPGSFTHLVTKTGLHVVDHIKFEDHHHYCDDEVKSLLEHIDSGSCDFLLTTTKDAVKLPRNMIPPQSCLVVEIGVAFVEGEDIFFSKLEEEFGA